MNDNLTLEELGNLSGLTLRTLRYYIQEGILQSHDTHGKFSRYSQQHLDRLELIQRLKNLRLPLQEIRHLLENITPDEISQIKRYQDVVKYNLSEPLQELMSPAPQVNGSSAIEYIQNLERGRESIRSISKPNPFPAPSPSASLPVPPQMRNTNDQKGQETWTCTILQDGVELNIRYPKSVEAQKKVNQLIDNAQSFFGDQTTREKRK